MAKKVFKIPDGNGGILYQIQTPDGKWHNTDEAGNILPEGGSSGAEGTGAERESLPEPVIPKDRKRERPSPSSKEGGYVNFSIHFSKADYKEFSDYIHWRCLFRENCSKASFLMRLALDAVQKDKEYREFKRMNQVPRP